MGQEGLRNNDKLKNGCKIVESQIINADEFLVEVRNLAEKIRVLKSGGLKHT